MYSHRHTHTQHSTLKNRRSPCAVVLDTVLIQPLDEALSSSFREARAGSEGPSACFLLYSILKLFLIFEQGTPPFHLSLGLTASLVLERGPGVFLCWRVQLCPTLCKPHGLWSVRLLRPWDSRWQEYWGRGGRGVGCWGCLLPLQGSS